MPAVPPSTEVCRIEGIASFRPGTQNGVPYTAADLHAAADNFARFSAGPAPRYTPYLSISHADHLAFGRVSAARVLADGTLALDAADVPTAVGAMVNARQLRQPSIEFFLPKLDEHGEVLDGFRGPDGEVVTTPVIKALTFLGNLPPAVKGLPDLPFATFAHAPPALFGGIVRHFSGDSPVDRLAAIQALAAAGMDTTSITDATPDAVLAAFLAAIQAAAQPAAPPGDLPEVPGDPVVAKNAAADNDADDINPGGMPGMASKDGPTVAAHTVKFTDASQTNALQGVLDKMQGQLDRIAADATARERASAGHQTAAKHALVKRFCDSVCADPKGARMTPAQRPALERMMLATDHTTVRKFSHGAATGTALDELMAEVSGWSVIRTFGEKLAAAPAAAPGMSAARRKELLSITPEGKAALALAAK